MKKILFYILIVFASLDCCRAAYLENVPQMLFQPNGDTLRCFASGDEYYSWLHDADGYTIIQNKNTGYYVYAAISNGKLIATNYVPGRVQPAAVGLQPGLRISAEEWQHRRQVFETQARRIVQTRDANINRGHINNIVVFIRFADDAQYENPISQVESMFNASAANSISLYNYFKTVSYGQLEISSVFFPIQTDSTVVSYQDYLPRRFFRPYSSANPDGYTEDQRSEREQALLARAIAAIADQIPDTLNVDYDNDGFVDNVVFVLPGTPEGWNDLLWPHQWSLFSEGSESFVNNKQVLSYNLQMAGDPLYFSVSTFCHEMNHTLGAPDLYHYYENTNWKPVGSWDLMQSNGTPPQNMGAYMKYKYGNWLDSIPEITECGIYSLYSLGSSRTHNCYKISTQDPHIFYVLEYRRKTDLFDSSIPTSGLLIYRINTYCYGNAYYDGLSNLDEVYIYRPNGTVTTDGSCGNAAFSLNLGRTEFHAGTNPQPFSYDGAVDSLFYIHQISAIGDSMTFTYCPQNYLSASTYDVEVRNLQATTAQFDITSDMSWQIISDCDWLDVSPSSGTGDMTITLTALEENTELDARECELILTSSIGYQRIVTVTQRGISPYILLSLDTNCLENTLTDDIHLYVSSNTDWNITTNVSWLTFSHLSGEGDDTVRITANTTNPSCASRFAILTLTSVENTSATTGVRQAGDEDASLEIIQTLSEMPPVEGGNYGFSIRTYANWTVSSMVNWLEFSPSSGTGNAGVSAIAKNANPNPTSRSAVVRVNDVCGHSEEFTVVQSPGYLHLSESAVGVGYAAGVSAELAVQCNGEWRVLPSSVPDWIEVTPATAPYASVTPITVTVLTDNDSDAPRVGTIIFAFGSMRDTLTIIQAPVSISENEKCGIKMYPVPVDDILTVEVDEPGQYAYLLFDAAGREVLGGKFLQGQNTINCESLQRGIYLLVLRNASGQTKARKLIKR